VNKVMMKDHALSKKVEKGRKERLKKRRERSLR